MHYIKERSPLLSLSAWLEGIMRFFYLIIFAFVLSCSALSPAISFAMKATTNNDAIACYSKSAMRHMLQFSAAGNKNSMSAYIMEKKCVVLKGGIDVTVIEPPDTSGGITGFVHRGLKMWTPRKGLRNYR